nr:MAG TPA: hypothetical protein [Caudoviricetes sp.]
MTMLFNDKYCYKSKLKFISRLLSVGERGIHDEII